MLYLNNKLLSIEGLADIYNAEVISKPEPKSPAPPLLIQFRKKLLSIYYPNITVSEFNPALIQSDRRFETYPKIKQALSFIFDSDNKDEISAQLASITVPKERAENAQAQWARLSLFTKLARAFRAMSASIVQLASITVPEERAENAQAQWGGLNRELGYFEDDTLLPLFTELARACRAMSALIEDNLADEEMPYIYAYRLMVLFASNTASVSTEDIAKKTVAFLEQAKHKQFTKPYHDVILNMIQLPPRSRIQDLLGWLRLINQKSIGINFLEYFAMAPQIEAQIQKESGEFKAPKDLSQAKAMATRCYYTRASEHLELAELCKAYNIPEDGNECSFNKCLVYLKSLPKWPMKERDNLPHPVIIGSGASEGYCWVKLPTYDLRALILGKITACCQSIGGHSELCVKDAVTLSDNGLFVLLKRKDKAPHSSHPYHYNKINDADFEIVGQSYAWISSTGNLTLDSLECSRGRVTTSVAKAILEQFSKQVLSENFSIKRITLGVGGQTPKDLGLTLTTIPEQMRSGAQYGDSRNQYCIFRHSKMPEAQFNEMMDKLGITGEFRDILNYLSDYLADTSPFEEELTDLLIKHRELQITFNRKKLFQLLSLTSTPTFNDLRPVDLESLEKLSEADRTQALSEISTVRMIWDYQTPEELLKRLNYISRYEQLRMIQNLRGILHQVRNKPDLLRTFLDMLPEEDRLQAIKEKNANGGTVLHAASDNLESLKTLLYMLPEEDRLELIKEKNRSEETVLHSARYSPKSLEFLISMYPKEERLKLIKEKDNYGKTVLHTAAIVSGSLTTLLSMLSEEERLQAIKEKARFGETVLYTAALYSESFKTLLDILPKAHFLELIKEKTSFGDTVLHIAASNLESFKTLLSLYPKEELLQAIKEKNYLGQTIFEVITKADSMQELLNALPPESFKDLPEHVLECPVVKQFIAKQKLKASQAALGVFKSTDESEGDSKTPKPS